MPDMLLWAVGLFEGEGSIGLRKSSARGRPERRYPVLSLQMTCVDVVQRFHAVVGRGRIHSRPAGRDGWKDSAVWAVSSARDVEALLTVFLPYLGEKKTREAEAVLLVCATIGLPMKERTHCTHGHEFTPANTGYISRNGVRQRRCLACRRERRRRKAV